MTTAEPKLCAVSTILLLDVMSTLVTEPFDKGIPDFFGMSFEEILQAVHPTAWVEFEHGQCDEASFLSRFFADGRPMDGEGLKRCLEDGYAWIDGIEALLTELREQEVQMHALSNYPVWYEVIEAKLGLSRYLRWTFVSCNTGYRKPHPEAYLGAARTLGVPPSQCLFVDDRKRNCAAAEAVGMPAIRFSGAEPLRAALIERGVLCDRSSTST